MTSRKIIDFPSIPAPPTSESSLSHYGHKMAAVAPDIITTHKHGRDIAADGTQVPPVSFHLSLCACVCVCVCVCVCELRCSVTQSCLTLRPHGTPLSMKFSTYCCFCWRLHLQQKEQEELPLLLFSVSLWCLPLEEPQQKPVGKTAWQMPLAEFQPL